MTDHLNRREFLVMAAATTVAAAAFSTQTAFACPLHAGASPCFASRWRNGPCTDRSFKHQVNNLDFPAIARREYAIGACEYVNQFFKDKGRTPNIWPSSTSGPPAKGSRTS